MNEKPEALIIELSSIMTITDTDNTAMLNIAVQKDYHDICKVGIQRGSRVRSASRRG